MLRGAYITDDGREVDGADLAGLGFGREGSKGISLLHTRTPTPTHTHTHIYKHAIVTNCKYLCRSSSSQVLFYMYILQHVLMGWNSLYILASKGIF